MGNIGERLRDRVKKLRATTGLSQVALANRAGVSVQTIKDVEAGRRGLGLKALEGISSALGISIEELKGKSEPRVEKIEAFKAKKMIQYFESIPDEIYELALELGDSRESVWEDIAETLLIAIEDKKLNKNA